MRVQSVHLDLHHKLSSEMKRIYEFERINNENGPLRRRTIRIMWAKKIREIKKHTVTGRCETHLIEQRKRKAEKESHVSVSLRLCSALPLPSHSLAVAN